MSEAKKPKTAPNGRPIGTVGASRFCIPMSELAGLIDVRSETLRNYIARGCPQPPKAGGRGAADRWAKRARAWVESDKGRRAAERAPMNEHTADPETVEYRREWQRLRTERLRIEVESQQQSLLPRRDVIDQAGKCILIVRTRMNALVSKMTGRLENVPSHVVAEELQDEVDAICADFAQGMTRTFGGIDPALPCPFCDRPRPH